MKQIFDLSRLEWNLSGWWPSLWEMSKGMETGVQSCPDVIPIPARVPGSVQAALRDAKILPDWNIGLNSRACEWVENRDWQFETYLPSDMIEEGKRIRLHCLGLDYRGTLLLNGERVGAFEGSFSPWKFDLTSYLASGENRLAIVFESPPRWLGQYGYTSEMTQWKPRFNYFWDWSIRLVQAGVWDSIMLEATEGEEIETLCCTTDVDPGTHTGLLHMKGTAAVTQADRVQISLEKETKILQSQELSLVDFQEGRTWQGLPVDLWHPHGCGKQPLYVLHVCLVDAAGNMFDHVTRRIGFKHVEWRSCEGAPSEADPWLCVVNGKPLFLQGVNWTPIRPNFADVTDEEYRQRLEMYRDLGCNLLRVWGGAVLEKQIFYDLCDEMGLLVWQEMPLSSSGIDNWPPEDEKSIRELMEIALSYISRRQHHVSLTIWCGGNELQGAYDGGKVGVGKPVDFSHPLMARWKKLFAQEDPTRRFLPTSASGPHFMADENLFGQGVHWDVHGLWQSAGHPEGHWTQYWQHDDALFRSETGSPGASPVDIIRAYAGDYNELPVDVSNPLWRRTSYHLERHEFGREPKDLEEYVAWSQARQATALKIAVEACKMRFPKCGGVLLWMGHDDFPCTANMSILDFWGRPKPAAFAVAEVFHQDAPAAKNDIPRTSAR